MLTVEKRSVRETRIDLGKLIHSRAGNPFVSSQVYRRNL
jgi:hypothetical protein